MRIFLMLAALGLASAAFAQAPDQTGKLGLGIELGEQNGGSAKYWINRDQAISAGLGVTASDDLGFHAEYLWHGWRLLPPPPKGDLAVHVGAGFRVRDDEFGLRPTAGLDYLLPGYPTEIFLDMGPVFRLSPDQGVDFTAIVGVRFYFAPGGRSSKR